MQRWFISEAGINYSHTSLKTVTLPVDASKEMCTLSLFTHVFIFWLCWVLAAAQSLSRGRGRGCSLEWVSGLLAAVASPVVGRGLQARGLSGLGSRTRACWHSRLGAGLGCSSACGILLGRGSNLWLLYWQADSYPIHILNMTHFLQFKFYSNFVGIWGDSHCPSLALREI